MFSQNQIEVINIDDDSLDEATIVFQSVNKLINEVIEISDDDSNQSENVQLVVKQCLNKILNEISLEVIDISDDINPDNNSEGSQEISDNQDSQEVDGISPGCISTGAQTSESSDDYEVPTARLGPRVVFDDDSINYLQKRRAEISWNKKCDKMYKEQRKHRKHRKDRKNSKIPKSELREIKRMFFGLS